MIGIIGGNGVAATNNLLDIIENEYICRGAFRDAHHPEMLVWQATQAPSRSMFLEGRGDSFVHDYIEIGKKMKNCGVTKLCMCCNTAHFAIDELEQTIKIPFINLLTECGLETKRHNIKKLGILASDGLVKHKLYDTTFKKLNLDISIIYPDEEYQKKVTLGICNVKNNMRFIKDDSNNSQKLFEMVIWHLVYDKKCDGILLGCTDINVGFNKNNFVFTPPQEQIIIIDSLEVLGMAIIEESEDIKMKNRIYGENTNIDSEKVHEFWEKRCDKDNPLQSIMLRNNDNIAEKRNIAEVKLLQTLIDFSKPKSILDIGCGCGRWVENLGKDKISYYDGIDFTRNYIDIANNNFANDKILFHNMSADKIDKNKLKAKYDIIIINALCMYLNDDIVNKVFDGLVDFLDDKSVIYLRESVSTINKRLTLKDFPSKELEATYNAIYRTPEEYENLVYKTKKLKILSSNFLLDQNLGAREETNQKYWLIRKMFN